MSRNIFCYIFLLAALLIPSIAQSSPAPKKFVVVIDAGHGGHDPGATNKKIREKDINLKTALTLGRLIEQNCSDVKVVYTRKTDVFVELQRRAQIANQAKADLFISIHTNAVPKGTVRGAETYTLGMARAEENLAVAKRENEAILLESNYKQTYKGFNPNSSESYIIFEYMQDANMSQSVNFAKKVQSQFRNNAKRIDKGVKQAGFLVLRETTMASVLIELGYISTLDEAQYLSSDNGSATMARSIYQAFVAYKKGKTGTGATSTLAETPEPIMTAEPEPAPVTKKEEAKVNEVQKTTSSNDAEKGAPVFKIQFMTADRVLKAGDAKFKGLKNVEHYKEGKIYKYTYGSSTNYNEIYKMRKDLLTKFKDCFIIAFMNGEKMKDVNEAIALFKANKK